MAQTKLRAEQVDVVGGGGRELLIANRTYYVRTDGNDSNSGLINDASGAFLTVQKAIDVVASIDLGAYDVVIQLGDGTYTDPVVVTGPFLGSGTVTIQGNNATPSNVVVSVTNNHAFLLQTGAFVALKDFKITTITDGNCIYVTSWSTLHFEGMDFGSCAGFAHIQAADGGAVLCLGDYSVSGGAATTHFSASNLSAIRIQNVTITHTNTPAFNRYASAVVMGSVIHTGCTFVGSCTGMRYLCSVRGLLYTTGGENYFPGNTAGLLQTEGYYL